ncbi:MAG: DNA alkylation repair protein, partial [Lachnospiraceae bacterium]|nr:DNA alkylation repair protein [Lachnospiraceae bacterium]
PELRKYAKQLVKENKTAEFLHDLPHKYFDENQLHAFILSELKDYETCIDEVCRFLPFVDNWATCDQMSPNVFKKHRTELLEYIKQWLDSKETYTVRFAIGMLMQHYLDDWFEITYAEMVEAVKSDEYYINMMIAWYFATALAKQYDNILPILEQHRLDTWTHNKVIQKAVESYRIMDEQKKYLKSLKIK